MTLDVSEAIALAKDLLETSSDFRPHDPDLADQFSSRAFEICNELGIDSALIGLQPTALQEEVSDDDTEIALVDMAPTDAVDEDAKQTSDELRDLLQQQAQVLENARQAEKIEVPKPVKRSFGLFSRAFGKGIGGLQSASA